MLAVRDYVNEAPGTASLGDLTSYLKESVSTRPIDHYYQSVSSILTYGTQDRLSENEFIGSLLLLGIVSAAENYIRAILARSIQQCPICQAHAAEKSINLGGLLWHGREEFSRSAFEHLSFADAAELRKAVSHFLAINLAPNEFNDVLSEFDKVCELRHGIVHSDSIIPGRNAVKLDIPRYLGPVRIVVGFAQLQEVADVTTNLVVLLNRTIFWELCKRWAIDWRRRADWDPTAADALFAKIWNSFISHTELSRRKGRSHISRSKCMAAVKAEFGL